MLSIVRWCPFFRASGFVFGLDAVGLLLACALSPAFWLLVEKCAVVVRGLSSRLSRYFGGSQSGRPGIRASDVCSSSWPLFLGGFDRGTPLGAQWLSCLDLFLTVQH